MPVASTAAALVAVTAVAATGSLIGPEVTGMNFEQMHMKRLFVLLVLAALPALAQTPAQPAFRSASDAARALYEAANAGNSDQIAKILGGPVSLASCSDPTRDQIERRQFQEKYRQMHRIGPGMRGSLTLYIGAENWPFPVPIVCVKGSCRFDAEAGAKEITYRRVGQNELAAIAASDRFAAEQKHAIEGNQESSGEPFTALFAKLKPGSPDSAPVPFHGYNFRVRPAGKTQGGADAVRLVAWPAEYRSSGVMTFVVSEGGAVYEKDLGVNTPAVAGGLTAVRKDGKWTVVN
jgi:hypothetical protein